MRMGCALGAVVFATCACGPSAAAPRSSRPGGAAAAACGPSGTRTLAADSHARIFAQGRSVYGCARGQHHSYLLGRSSLTRPGQARLGVVALAGIDAAFSQSQMGVDTASAEVVVRRLDDGRTIHTANATTTLSGPESFQSVVAIVIKSDGAVAWTATESSIVSHAKSIEVDRVDRRGEATLDRSLEIVMRSLRLRGSRLSWRHGSVTRSATLL